MRCFSTDFINLRDVKFFFFSSTEDLTKLAQAKSMPQSQSASASSRSKLKPGAPRWKATDTFGGILRTSGDTEPVKRRISLQEEVEFSEDSKS
ncbi:hypothetical protein TNCV_544931 [Trichonephila clavipes]|nr:hypothetical protein TNCV_544931 [Trichonephila clavipes]